MKRLSLVLPALLLALACQRPEVERFRVNPTPVAVVFEIPKDIPNAPDISREYAAVLRARLATRVKVVPEGVKPPLGAAELRVEITDLEPGTSPKPSAAGVVAAVAAGTLIAATDTNHFFEGFFWGAWLGAHASAQADRDPSRLGFRPHRVSAVATLTQDGVRGPLWTSSVRGRAVVEAMEPLGRTEREDPVRIREEEARAFAQVILEKLQDKFGWEAKTAPSFYQDPAAPKDGDPAPAPGK